MGIVAGLGFGGWYSAEAVHEALLVVPGDVVGVRYSTSLKLLNLTRRNGESARTHSVL